MKIWTIIYLLVFGMFLSLSAIWVVSCDKDEQDPVVEIRQDEYGFKSATDQLLELSRQQKKPAGHTMDVDAYGKAGFRVTQQFGNTYKVEVMLGTAQPTTVADLQAISMVLNASGNLSIIPFIDTATNKPYIIDPILVTAANSGMGSVMVSQHNNTIYFSFFSLTPVRFFSTSMKSLFTFLVVKGVSVPSTQAYIEWNTTHPWYNEISLDGYNNLNMTWDNYIFE